MLGLYFLRDRVSGSCGEPFACENDNVAIRQFAATCSMCDSPFTYRAIRDTECLYIGSFNPDVSPALSPCPPRIVFVGSDSVFRPVLDAALDRFYGKDDVEDAQP